MAHGVFKKFNITVQMNKKALELYREYQSGKLEVNKLINKLADLCEIGECKEEELIIAEMEAGICIIPTLAAAVELELHSREHPEMRGKIFLE